MAFLPKSPKPFLAKKVKTIIYLISQPWPRLAAPPCL